jgi:hypothetical protein
LHEIKHDGFRILARREIAGVRLFAQHGHDLSALFPLIRTGMLKLAREHLPDLFSPAAPNLSGHCLVAGVQQR